MTLIRLYHFRILRRLLFCWALCLFLLYCVVVAVAFVSFPIAFKAFNGLFVCLFVLFHFYFIFVGLLLFSISSFYFFSNFNYFTQRNAKREFVCIAWSLVISYVRFIALYHRDWFVMHTSMSISLQPCAWCVCVCNSKWCFYSTDPTHTQFFSAVLIFFAV